MKTPNSDRSPKRSRPLSACSGGFYGAVLLVHGVLLGGCIQGDDVGGRGPLPPPPARAEAEAPAGAEDGETEVLPARLGPEGAEVLAEVEQGVVGTPQDEVVERGPEQLRSLRRPVAPALLPEFEEPGDRLALAVPDERSALASERDGVLEPPPDEPSCDEVDEADELSHGLKAVLLFTIGLVIVFFWPRR